MFKPVNVTPLPDYRVRIRYADGVDGDVDLSHLAGKGVFALWNDPSAFSRVCIGRGGAISWSDEVDLCPDALYMKITGKSPEEVFPNLAKAEASDNHFCGICVICTGNSDMNRTRSDLI